MKRSLINGSPVWREVDISCCRSVAFKGLLIHPHYVKTVSRTAVGRDYGNVR